jgi:hypothetical protein
VGRDELQRIARFFLLIFPPSAPVVLLFCRNSIDYTKRYNYGEAFIPTVLKALGDKEFVEGGEAGEQN